MQKRLFTITLLFLFVIPFLHAQNNIDLNSLPDVDDIMVQSSNLDADTIIIGMHGGPTDMLYPGDFDFFQQTPSFSVVEVMQYQHYNPEILQDSEVTLDQGIVYNDTTVAMLQKVVLNFTDQGKTVVIMGHSFGAFIMTEYVDDYGMDDVHRVIPMAGRMNINDEFWMAYEAGYGGYFGGDGLDPIIPTEMDDEDVWATMKLMAGLGYNRWIDSLATEDLTKFMYVYGEYDEAVGRLLPEETNMIESVNGSTLMVPEGDHGSMFAPEYMNQILDFIREDQIVINIENYGIDDVLIYPTILTNFITIQASTRGELSIWSSHGQLVQSFDCGNGINSFQLPSLVKGLYVATFKDEKGYLHSQQKLIAN